MLPVAMHSQLYSSRQLCNPCRPCKRVCRRQLVSIRAQANPRNPPDAPPGRDDVRRGGREWLQSLLSRFGPITEKSQNTAILDFEKPLVELDNRIKEVGRTGLHLITLRCTHCLTTISFSHACASVAEVCIPCVHVLTDSGAASC